MYNVWLTTGSASGLAAKLLKQFSHRVIASSQQPAIAVAMTSQKVHRGL